MLNTDHIERHQSAAGTASLRHGWLLGKRQLLELAGFWLAFVAIGWGIGELLVRPDSRNGIVRVDNDVATWFVDRRTTSLDSLSHAGSMLSDTMVKIVVTSAAVGFILAAWRRWLEPSIVACALILEAAAFISITWLVGRPRPDVARLEGSPVDSSFPSGHVAAAAAYAAIAVVVSWHFRRRLVSALMYVVVAAIVAVVAWARLYRGMHHLSDVIAGVLLGAASVQAVVYVLVRAHRTTFSNSDDPTTTSGSIEAGARG